MTQEHKVPKIHKTPKIPKTPTDIIAWTNGRVDDPAHEYWNVEIDKWVVMPVAQTSCLVDTTLVKVVNKTETPSTKVALLMMIYVPESNRKKGRATEIVRQLEQRANTELGIPLAIGPIFDETDAMTKLCTRRLYKPLAPYSWIQKTPL